MLDTFRPDIGVVARKYNHKGDLLENFDARPSPPRWTRLCVAACCRVLKHVAACYSVLAGPVHCAPLGDCESLN